MSERKRGREREREVERETLEIRGIAIRDILKMTVNRLVNSHLLFFATFNLELHDIAIIRKHFEQIITLITLLVEGQVEQ